MPTQYPDPDGDSGIDAFDIGDDYIVVYFKKGRHSVYRYTYGSAGQAAIEQMKTLANHGNGLNSYISLNKPAYESKR